MCWVLEDRHDKKRTAAKEVVNANNVGRDFLLHEVRKVRSKRANELKDTANMNEDRHGAYHHHHHLATYSQCGNVVF
jgi:hypothetical protein